MAARICALLSLLALSLTLSVWHKSYHRPEQGRYDLTLYKSIWFYVGKGVCAMHVLSMPSKVPSRSAFRATFNQKVIESKGHFELSSQRQGLYRHIWLIFPLWVPNLFFLTTLTLGVLYGPLRRWKRNRAGCCVACGYNLRGSLKGRCPECGTSTTAKRKR